MWQRELNSSILTIVFWVLLIFALAMIGQLLMTAAVLIHTR